MGLLQRAVGLVLLFSQPCCADPLSMYDARLCYILDGFLAGYGLIITGLYIKEKFFTSKTKKDGGKQISKRSQEGEYTELKKRKSNDEYRELPVKGRQRNTDQQIYQDLNQARDRDTYNTLQTQPAPGR